MRGIYFLYVFIIFSFCSYSQEDSAINALNPEYRFAHKGVADGLSPGAVNDFYKEENGFLWIATTSGLNRYDGYEFQHYSPKSSNPSAIQSRNFRRVFKGPLGNIWCETPEGINIFDPIDQSFTSDQNTILRSFQISDSPVEDIVSIEDDFLLIHKDASVTRVNEKNSKDDLKDYNAYLKQKGLRPASVVVSNKNGLWVIYTNGLIHKLDISSFSIISEYEKLKENFGEEEHDFRLVIDENGDLWIHLFQDYGVFYYQIENDQLNNYTKESTELQLSSNLISAIEKDVNGNIWIGSDLGGINVVDVNDLSVRYIKNNAEIGNTLSHNSITSLYADQDGILWIGTFKNGIDYYHPNIIRFPLQKKVLSNPESLPFNDVNVFTEDIKGNLYIGTNGGGLLKLDQETGKYQQFLHDAEDPNSISSDVIVSLLFDSKNRLWAGTYLGGLNLLTKDGFKHFRHNPKDSTSIAGDNIWELFEDSKGRLWIGTLTGGVDIYDEENNRFIHSFEGGGKFPIHANYISSINEDQNGKIWIGTSYGIDIIDPLKNVVKHLYHIPGDSTSLSDDNILAIYKDKQENMWVGSHRGLNLYSGNDDVFYHYGKEDGLPGEKIIGIVEDDDGDLWITSSFGIAQFKKGDIGEMNGRISPDFKIYNDLDGLQGNLFNENSIYKNKDGEILVGGLHGFNVFKPQEFEYNEKKPKIIFTEFSLFNEDISVGEKIGNKILLKKPLYKTEKITLKHDQNFFSIEFAALDFFQPSKNNYRYKLEGVDNGWQNLSNSQRVASYTNIDPGTYNFRVQASNNDQVWNREGAMLSIEILPPFYKTIYAYIGYVIFILGLLYLGRRRIIQKQRKNFEIQQEKREAAHLHKMDLMKIRFFTNISHEFKTPLSMILSPVSRLNQQHLGPHVKEQINIINDNAQRLLNLINQVLDLGNVKNDTLLTSSKANIVDFINDIVNGFKDYAESKGVKLFFVSEESKFFTIFDMDKLDKIVYNLLSNAVKFTPEGGEIHVSLEVGESILDPKDHIEKKIFIIKVKDTGVGIAEKDRPQIFDRFYKADLDNDLNKTGSGIGLALVQEYVKLYSGEINVDSKEGSGSLFTIKLPLQKIPPIKIASDKEKISNKILGENDSLPTVLIIDDSREFLNYLGKTLRESYNLFIAVDGETGWKKTLSIVPDLIICDWEMPGMKGTDLCLKIRNDARTKHIPFILLSGNQSEENKLAGLKAGANDYITKPFKLEVLKSRIDNLIEQRKSFQEAYRKKIEVPKITNQVTIETEDEKLMRKVLQIIKSNYQNPDFGVERLAVDLGVSRSFLYNKTLSLFEKTPSELITDIRLEKGKELLAKSQLTISEIAFKTGFNNPKYFTKNFKKKYDILPSAYKKKHS
ncbi:response regulator [Zunongwangia sp. SCSIO 43204]|uniref:hybrid sensor histidine kinase/response regulator transcription factor n=1 Tax=Zunongwangia sp. SCSIO 43204 TaxID=2779359 RepID=UPI001CA99A89|nr:hybrid sensor histidine kinase/response regulator transcription factor [Zunongwangia sp. SCSIO 43204]UAB83246.1 response regulator [Zunongwangia sp. SCSIO 43204]